MKDGDIEILRQIDEHERTIDWTKEGADLGWEWRDVRIQPATLTRLFLEGLLDCPFDCCKYVCRQTSAHSKFACRCR